MTTQATIEHTRLRNDLHDGLIQGWSGNLDTCALCRETILTVSCTTRDGYTSYHRDCILTALQGEPMIPCVACGRPIPALFPDWICAGQRANGEWTHDACTPYTPAGQPQ